MKNDLKQNQVQSNLKLQKDKLDKEYEDTEQEGYVDDTDFGPEVIKRSPNLVDTDVNDNSVDDFDNDLDDDEDPE